MKYIAYIFSIVLLMTSCMSTINLWNADSNMRKIEIGMTKSEVVAIMGKTYEVVGASQEQDGTVEMIGYPSSQTEIYVLYFLDGILQRWQKEWMSAPSQYHSNQDTSGSYTPFTSTTSDNSAMKAHLDAHRAAMLNSATSDAERSAINTHMDAHTQAAIGNP